MKNQAKYKSGCTVLVYSRNTVLVYNGNAVLVLIFWYSLLLSQCLNMFDMSHHSCYKNVMRADIRIEINLTCVNETINYYYEVYLMKF